MLRQAQGNICIFSGIGASELYIHLVKGELFNPFTRNIYIFNRLIIEVMFSQGIHIMSTSGGIQDVRLHHAINNFCLPLDIIIGEDVDVVF